MYSDKVTHERLATFRVLNRQNAVTSDSVLNAREDSGDSSVTIHYQAKISTQSWPYYDRKE